MEKVITVWETPPYGHAPTYQISLTYLERQKSYVPDKKILFKNPLFDLEVKVPRRSLWYATHRLMVMHPHTKYNWTIWKDKKSYGPDKLRWEEAEEEEQIRLKQYVSLCSKGRHKIIRRHYIYFCFSCWKFHENRVRKWRDKNFSKKYGFIWNIWRNILVWKYFWSITVQALNQSFHRKTAA